MIFSLLPSSVVRNNNCRLHSASDKQREDEEEEEGHQMAVIQSF
jgi:hypothetical protein